jgi:hypothetical protein
MSAALLQLPQHLLSYTNVIKKLVSSLREYGQTCDLSTASSIAEMMKLEWRPLVKESNAPRGP